MIRNTYTYITKNILFQGVGIQRKRKEELGKERGGGGRERDREIFEISVD